jgi:hypothetical protein
MAEKPTDSYSPLSAGEADEIARQLTGNRMGVVFDVTGAYLIHIGKRTRVHLLPYQLKKRRLEEVIRENDPWHGD